MEKGWRHHFNKDTSSKGSPVGTGAVLVGLSLLLKRY
jgi:hypothetical protein